MGRRGNKTRGEEKKRKGGEKDRRQKKNGNENERGIDRLRQNR